MHTYSWLMADTGSLASNVYIWWAAQVVAIIILLYFLLARKWGFLGGQTIGAMLGKMLDARQEQIRTQLAAAERSREEAQRMHQQAEQEIAQARQEAQQIVARAQSASQAIETEMQQRAQSEYQRIVSQARSQIDYEREQAELALRRRAADIVVDAAGEVIERYMTPQTDQRIIDQSLANLKEIG